MGRPTLAEAKDTKAELSRVAMEMIQTRGYNAFSYQDLADRLNIRKASIHYHFPTKEDLGISLMEGSIERLTLWQQDIRKQDLSALTRMEAYFDYFANISANGVRICPCGALATEWNSLPVKLQEAVTKLLSTHREWIKGTLEKGRKSGEIAKTGTVEEQAQFVFASVQGALQTSRVQGNPGYFRAVTRQLLSSLYA
jgi:TetR/AcrR family transcriptional regulator, transcriptional repressor for nem operon